jgi:DMSO/TMAO reductase YedYZ molybdopterin-dependent catalytic subunit
MMKNPFKRRQDEELANKMNRLPPGQSLTNKFPVLHYGPVPKTNLDEWTLNIFGLVKKEISWTWEAFNQLPKTTLLMDIHCVTRWSKLDTKWEGVSVGRLIQEGFITIKPEARYVIQHCEYGYTTNTPLDWVLADNFLLATHYDGKPLTPEHGYPLRAVIGSYADRREKQSAYFWKGGKWLRALEFRADDAPGFWEKSGYHNEGDPWQEQRFSGGN